MIVRVIRARVRYDDVGTVNTRLRPFFEVLRTEPGLAYLKLARRLLPDRGQEFICVQEWLTPADLHRWTHGRLVDLHLPLDVRPLLHDVVITHYEALDRMPEEMNLVAFDTPAGSGVRT